MNSETCPPHEMSYLTIKKLQYGATRAQESDLLTSTCSTGGILRKNLSVAE